MEAMIKVAAEVGVDIVKFQSFRAVKLRKDYPNYEQEYAYYKAHELSMADHVWLIRKCEEYGVEFLTTVFDPDTVDFLVNLGLKQVKIASPDANNWELIDKCMKAFDKVIISTGMHTGEEVFELRAYCNHPFGKAVILHCISQYPADIENINLCQIVDGFSDHTIGTDAAKLAIALGADYIERHFTLSRHLPGKDQFISSTPEEFAELVAWKNKVKLMMGSGTRKLSEQELENRKKYRGRWSA